MRHETLAGRLRARQDHDVTSDAAAPTRPVFRFAPSPNGRLHRGHALSALTNERFARRLGGALLLRIEDIDIGRCRPEFEAAIDDDLGWLGLRFDGSVRRQSEHFDDYRAALGTLRARGLLYACRCSRSQVRAAITAEELRSGAIWPRDPDGAALYPGTCRALTVDPAEDHVLRLDMKVALAVAGGGLGYRRFDEAGVEAMVAVDPARWGDVVLARREVPTSYHLSVVVDDALQGVSHVVRGRDLEAATDVHVLLQRLLGLPVPRYHFHQLIRDEAGEKLAKSRGSRSLADLRAAGVTAQQIRAELGFGAASAGTKKGEPAGGGEDRDGG